MLQAHARFAAAAVLATGILLTSQSRVPAANFPGDDKKDSTDTWEQKVTLKMKGTGFCLVFSPDGSLFMRATPDWVKAWNSDTGEEVFSSNWQPESLGHDPTFSFTRDNKSLVHVSTGGHVFVWDLKTSRLTSDWRLGNPPGNLRRQVERAVISPDGASLAVFDWVGQGAGVSAVGEKKVKIYDMEKHSVRATLPISDAENFRFTADGKELALTRWNIKGKTAQLTVQVFDVAKGNKKAPFVVPASDWNFAKGGLQRSAPFLNGDGSLLCVYNREKGGVQVLDVGTGKVLQTLKDPEKGIFDCRAAVTTGDKHVLFVRTGTDRWAVRDITTGKDVINGNGHLDKYDVGFSPEGNRFGGVVRINGEAVIKIWKRETKTREAK